MVIVLSNLEGLDRVCDHKPAETSAVVAAGNLDQSHPSILEILQPAPSFAQPTSPYPSELQHPWSSEATGISMLGTILWTPTLAIWTDCKHHFPSSLFKLRGRDTNVPCMKSPSFTFFTVYEPH